MCTTGTTLVLIILCFSYTFVHAAAEDHVDRHFEWKYRGRTWTWDLSIPLEIYNTYNLVTPSERILEEYCFLVTTKDPFIMEAANELHAFSQREGYGSYDEVSFVLAFVQSLPYTSDYETSGYEEYPRFPIETLVDYGGDCEDTSILFATMITLMDYDAVLIKLPEHMAVGVWAEGGVNVGYYEHDGKKYFYCETTNEGWKIGQIPSEYESLKATIVSIDKERQYNPYKIVDAKPPILVIIEGIAIFFMQPFFITFGLPIIGAVLLIHYIEMSGVRKRNAKSINRGKTSSLATEVITSEKLDLIKKLTELREADIISEQEFQKLKGKLLERS
jgi:hypothetical protein